MHIPDGFLAPTITVPAYAAAAPLWAWAVRRHFGPSQVEALPAVGALTAVAFVLQTIMIPVPGGTSTHLVGAGLLAMLHGPLVAFVCESLVLLLQALFFGAGGITVLGVNALAMGLLGPLVAWAVYAGLRQWAPKVGAFAGAYLGMQVSTLLLALALGLQHRLSPAQFPTPFPVMLAAMMLPSLTVAGLVEGLYSVFAMGVLRRARGKTGP
jgi:cobalt/nickel transport system permease protein